MAKDAPKWKIKDSICCNVPKGTLPTHLPSAKRNLHGKCSFLFRDKKYLLQLYQALHPEDRDVTEDDITNVTLNSVLVDADYNDLGFMVRDQLMILAEGQSTWSVNIIVRMLMYLVQTYHDYLKRTGQNVYGSKKVKLPKPELYVIYTGDRKNMPDTISLSSEFFGGETVAVDAEVKVLYQENENDIIGQYIIFCKVYDEQRMLYGRTRQAIKETIRVCKDRDVLKGFLENREKEVVDIMNLLYSEDEIRDMFVHDIEGATERKTAENLIKKGKMSLEDIADCVPSLSMEELKEIEAEVMQPA